MMPLKEKTTGNKVEKKQDSEALKTEEILSLLSKTRQDFIKDKEILEKIPNLFKKKTLIELANSSENKKSKSQEIQKSEIQQKNENTKIENESSEDKKEEADCTVVFPLILSYESRRLRKTRVMCIIIKADRVLFFPSFV